MTWNHAAPRAAVFGAGAHSIESFSIEARARRMAQLVECERQVCPRCGQTCWLEPIARGGAFRLVDPDGGFHLQTCAGVVRRSA